MCEAGGFRKANLDQGTPNDARMGGRGRPVPQRSGIGRLATPTKTGPLNARRSLIALLSRPQARRSRRWQTEVKPARGLIIMIAPVKATLRKRSRACAI